MIAFGTTTPDHVAVELVKTFVSKKSELPMVEARVTTQVEFFSGTARVWIAKDELFTLLDGLAEIYANPTSSFEFESRGRQIRLSFTGQTTGQVRLDGWVCQNPESRLFDRDVIGRLVFRVPTDQTQLQAAADDIRRFIAGSF